MRRIDFRAIPKAYPGMRIGLFGGTFDPAHAGHRHVAETAAKRLRLDKVWWLVTPQNPLKPRQAGPLAARMASARRQARGARMVVTDFETRLGLFYSVETVEALSRRLPGVRFVWILGADSLEGLHRWRRWRDLAAIVPIAAVPRPGASSRANPATRLLGRALIRLPARLRPESSTALREEGAPFSGASGAPMLTSHSLKAAEGTPH